MADETRLSILKRIGESVIGKVSGVVTGGGAAVSNQQPNQQQANMSDAISGLLKDALDLDSKRNSLLEENYDATMQVVKAIQEQTKQNQRNTVAERRSAIETAAEGVRGTAGAVRGTARLGRDAVAGAAGAVSGAFKGLLGAPGELLKSISGGLASFADPKAIVGAGIIAGLGFGFIKLLEGVTKFVENNSVGELVKEGGTLALLVGGLGLVAAKVTKSLLLPSLAIMGGLTLAALGIAYAVDLAAPGLTSLTNSLSGLVTATGNSGQSLLDLALGLGALSLALPAFAAGTAVAAGITGLMNLFGAGNPLSEVTKMLDSLPDQQKVEGLETTLNSITRHLKTFTGELSEIDFDAIREAGENFEQFADSYDSAMTDLGVKKTMVQQAKDTATSTASKIAQGLRYQLTGEEATLAADDPRIAQVPPSPATRLPTVMATEALPAIIQNTSEAPIPVEMMPSPDGTGMLNNATQINGGNVVINNNYNTNNVTNTQQSVDQSSSAVITTLPAIAGA